MVSKSIAAISLVIVIVLCVTAIAILKPEVFGIKENATDNTGPSPSPGTTEQNFGSFDVKTKGYSSLDFQAQYNESTHYTVTWVAMRGGSPTRIGSNTQTLQLTQQDYGLVWAVVKPVSGYYVDASQTVSKNDPYVSVSQYGDIDNDGYEEWAFKCDLSQTPAAQGVGNNRVMNFYPYLMAYGAITLNHPTDISAIGTGSAQNFVDWVATFATVNHAFAVTKVEVVANTTQMTDITIAHVDVPGVPNNQVTSSMFGQPYRGTDSLTWTYTIANSLNGAQYLHWSSNSQNKQDFSAQFGTRLTAGEVIVVTLNIYGIDETGTPVALVTDAVNLAEA